MKFSSRSFKWQGSAYFFFAAAAFFFGAAFLVAAFLAAGFFAASFLAGFFAAAFLVAIDNPPFQSADAVRRKFGGVVDEIHHSIACVLRNETVAHRQRIFSCAVGEIFI